MIISSRTPEGTPNRCPVCNNDLKIEPSSPAGDAPCPYCGHLLWFSPENAGDVQVIKPAGNLDCPESLDRFVESVELRPGIQLILDFSDVQSISSAALGKLITLDKKVKAHGGTLRLSNIRPEIYEVFAITKLNKLFDIRDDEANALHAFAEA